MTNIAIVGAGLAGLSLAKKLAPQTNVTVFEKSRGVSGRMSTRRTPDYAFDHGAQFFTAKSSHFQDFLKPFIEDGSVVRWTPRIRSFNDAEITDTTKDLWVAAPRMTSLCKALTSNAAVKLETEIQQIETKDKQHYLTSKAGKTFGPFDWIISTAPAPQTQKLLASNAKVMAASASTKMSGCFCLMIGLASQPDIDWDAAYVAQSPIGWMANNSSKPGRPQTTSLVIQSTNTWAEENMEVAQGEVRASLTTEAEQVTGLKLHDADYVALHRWRYAATPQPAAQSYILDEEKRVASCGDWCVAGRVEAAFLSAHQLADALKAISNSQPNPS